MRPTRPPAAEAFTVGEFLRDEMAARGWVFDDLVERAGLPRGYLARLLLDQVGLWECFADRLGRALGTSATLWLSLARSAGQLGFDEPPWRNAVNTPGDWEGGAAEGGAA
jgi:plasmid maintenance system antidote protein VapI